MDNIIFMISALKVGTPLALGFNFVLLCATALPGSGGNWEAF